MPGKLIDLEGIDNCGKTTQAYLVSAWLNSRKQPSVVTKELTTPVGRLIKWYFGQESFPPILKVLLFAGDRFIRQVKEVSPAINKGKIVIADRWVSSAVVYRAVESISTDYVIKVNDFALKPDVIIILDVPAALAVERGKLAKRPCPYSLDFLKKARLEYLRIAETVGAIVIDGSLPKDQVTQEILRLLKQ